VESVELEEEWLEQNQGDGAPMGMGGGMRDGSRRLDRVMDEVSEGTQGDMLLGLVMGFVFGIIMLFWIWERGIPRRQKLGILCGIACNLTVSPAPPFLLSVFLAVILLMPLCSAANCNNGDMQICE
jgi:hypothetical protein